MEELDRTAIRVKTRSQIGHIRRTAAVNAAVRRWFNGRGERIRTSDLSVPN